MKPIKKVFARQLRSDQTDAEKLAWMQLRDRRCYGLKFRRQHVIEGFVVDFYCDQIALAIEVDGGIHKRRREYDEARDDVICSKGVSIIRIENEAVAQNRNIINKKVKSFLIRNKIPFQNPSPSGRGSLALPKIGEGR
ncbi:MAG: endonuclease domain-containing protein [Candidatus Margulisiibacteriota bacterium]